MNAQFERIEDQVTTVVVEPTSVETETPGAEKVRVEEFKLSRDAVVTFVKDLIQKGKIRRLAIHDKEGQTVLEIPLLPGAIGLVFGAALFPVAAVIGTVAVLATNYTLVIERKES